MLKYQIYRPFIRWDAEHALAPNFDAAFCRLGKTGDHAEQGGFAATRWAEKNDEFPFLDVEIDERGLWNRIGSKHVRPTSLPATVEDAKVEWATAAVAIREAVREHAEVMRGMPAHELPGPFDMNSMLREDPKRPDGPPRLKIKDYDLVIGSGGILSHSPREAAAMMLKDALDPDGILNPGKILPD